MSTAYHLHPTRVAYYEAFGWRAYYEHNWLQVLRLIVGLCQEQFHIPFPQSLLAGYYTTRASIAWVPVDHDVQTVLTYLRKFYRIAGRYSRLYFDVERVASLELQYFVVHRDLSGKEDKTELIQTMADLHSAIFGITPAQALASAQLRVQAMNIVDTITSNKSLDPASDWAKLEEYLRQCYTSIEHERAANKL